MVSEYTIFPSRRERTQGRTDGDDEDDPRGRDSPDAFAPQQQEIGLERQATLTKLVDLALLGKQLHWSVVEPGFRVKIGPCG